MKHVPVVKQVRQGRLLVQYERLILLAFYCAFTNSLNEKMIGFQYGYTLRSRTVCYI